MPFCTECGKQVGLGDVFCAGCGAKQAGGSGAFAAGPGPGPTSSSKDIGANIPARTVAALCYVPAVGWLSSLYVLAGERFRNQQMVRFHAFQGLYLFVGWLVIGAVVPMIGNGWRLTGILRGALSLLGVVMMFKTLRNQDERLPFVGDLADRSIREQR